MKQSALRKRTDATLKPHTTLEPSSSFPICAKRDYPNFAGTLARWERLPSSWASTSVLPCYGLLRGNGNCSTLLEQVI